MESVGQKITEKGSFVTVDGEKIKVGILDRESGNARVFGSGNRAKIKGIFALVQWYRRDEPLEKIAYNVVATSTKEAKREMATWIPKLQYSAFRETSELIRIVKI